jgi:hypothetical protein
VSGPNGNAEASQGDTVTVDYDASDGNGIDSVTVKVEDGDGTQIGTNTDSSVSGNDLNGNTIDVTLDSEASEGNYNVVVEATDTETNTGSDTGTDALYVDNTNPDVNSATISNSPISNSDTGTQDVTVNFDEDMDQSVAPSVSITGLASSDYTVNSKTGDSYTNGFSGPQTWEGTVTINDDDEEKTGTIDVTGAEDPAGNTLGNLNSNTFQVDTIAPTVNSVNYKDTNTDGQVDRVDVVYSEDISSSTIENADWSLTGNDAGSIDFDASGTQVSSDTVQLAVTGTPTDTTSVDLSVEYTDSSTSGSITDGNNPAPESGTVSASDGASPVVTSAAYRDSNDDDGTVDKVDVDFSETVDYTASGTPSDDWSLTAQDITGLSISDSTTDSSGSEITLDVSADSGITGVDSGTEPTIDVASGSPPVEDQSSSSNTAVQVSGSPVTMTDETAPSFKSVTTVDSEPNGKLDGLTVEFTEAVADDSVETADLSFGDKDGLSGSITGVSGNGDSDSTVTVDLSEGGSTDTGATPTLDYSEDGSNAAIQDSGGNEMADQISNAATDDANPVATETVTQDSNTDGSIDQVQIKFSEAVNLNDASDDSIPGISLDNSDMSISNSDYEDGSSVTVGLQSDVSGTSATTGLTYSSPSGDGVVDQNQGLELVTDATQTDGAAPVLKYAEVDHVDSTSSATTVALEFSESVEDTDGTSDGVWIDGTGFDFNSKDSASTIDIDYTSVLQTGDSPLVNMSDVVTDGSGNSAVNMSGNNVEVDTFRKDLSSGWNFVSFPIADSTSPSLDSVLDMDKVDVVWEYDSDGWTSSNAGLDSVEGGQGYFVKASSDHTIDPNVNNKIASDGTYSESTPGTESLHEGWNLVGQFQEFKQSADASGAFSSLGSSSLGSVYAQGSGLGVNEITGGTANVGDAFWVSTSGDLSGGSIAYTEN